MYLPCKDRIKRVNHILRHEYIRSRHTVVIAFYANYQDCTSTEIYVLASPGVINNKLFHRRRRLLEYEIAILVGSTRKKCLADMEIMSLKEKSMIGTH